MVPFAHTAATQNRAFSVAGPKIWKKPTRNCEQKVFVLTSEAAYTAKLKCNEDKQKRACEKIEKRQREKFKLLNENTIDLRKQQP